MHAPARAMEHLEELSRPRKEREHLSLVVRSAQPKEEAPPGASGEEGPEPNMDGATFEERHGHERYKNPEIDKKWGAMDDVFGIMFTIACRAKHSKDVSGEAKAILKAGAVGETYDWDDYLEEMKKIQKANIGDFKQSCGQIPAKGLPKCRGGCQDSHGDNFATRSQCDAKCVKKYRDFESECEGKAEMLGNVYDVELGKLNSYQSCAALHCPDYPVTDGDDCDVEALDGCKEEMVTDMVKTATHDFCASLWDWISETEARDPKTGDPIVFSQLFADVQQEPRRALLRGPA